MKRLVAFTIVFALFTAAVFAQVSGTVETRMYLVDTVFEDNAPAVTHGGIHTAAITMTGRSPDGKIGGQLRIRAENMTSLIGKAGHSDDDANLRFHKAFVWWRPIEQIRVFLGMDPDGLFESAILAGWNYHQGNEQYIGFQWWDFWRAVFPGNWDTFGLALSVYAVKGVEINLIIPTGGPSVDDWPRHHNTNAQREVRLSNMYPWGLRLNAAISIPDIGKVYFSWIGPENYRLDQLKGEEGEYNNYGDVGLSFLLNGPIQGFQAQVGFSTKIPAYSDIKYPFLFGAAAYYASGDWGVKFRLGAGINMTFSDGKNIPAPNNKDFYLHSSIMPYYNINNNMRINVDFGGTFIAPDQGDSRFGWWLTPYFTMGPFQAGITIHTIGNGKNAKDNGWENNAGYLAGVVTKDAPVKFAIPIKLTFGF
jgi:hypothetical protein